MKSPDGYNHEINESYGTIKSQSANMNNSLRESHNLSLPTHITSINSDRTEIFENINKQEILEKINNFELSDDAKYFVEGYEKIFHERNIFLWKFLGTVFQETGVTLSTVDKDYIDSTTDVKIIFSILCAILDDVTDVHKDKELRTAMSELLTNGMIPDKYEKDKKILLIKKMWEYLRNELSKYPRYEEFKDIFMYDFKQFLNAFEYSCLVNENPSMLNLQERENYDCHNMMVYLFNGIDLMASPEFNKEDLSHMRTAFWHAQKMARIGNWLSTWKRELKENDVGSGIFAYAISKKILDTNDIEKLPENEIITRIENSDIYQHFLNAWQQNYEKLKSLKEHIRSVDMDAYIAGLENIIKFHLASEGLK